MHLVVLTVLLVVPKTKNRRLDDVQETVESETIALTVGESQKV
jgi:hypothetical protein